MVVLAWAGLALGQQPMPPSSAPGDRTERTMTLHEAGKPSQKCKVLKSWRQPDGTMAYQVQALETGEMITVVESGPAPPPTGPAAEGGPAAMTTRIYHWGRYTTPPPGTPVPPETAAGLSTVAAKEPGTTAAAKAPGVPAAAKEPGAPAAPEIIKLQEPGKPEQKCKVLKTYRQPDGKLARQVEVLGTGEILTIIEGSSGPGESGTGGGPRALTNRPRILPLGRNHSPAPSPSLPATRETRVVPPAPTPPPDNKPGTSKLPGQKATAEATPVMGPAVNPVNQAAPKRWQSVIDSTFIPSAPPAPETKPAASKAGPKGPHPEPAVISPKVSSAPEPVKKTQPGPQAPKPAIAVAPPSDWRSSWGKPEEPQVRPPAKLALPSAGSLRPDPLADPDRYTRRPPQETRSDGKVTPILSGEGKPKGASPPPWWTLPANEAPKSVPNGKPSPSTRTPPADSPRNGTIAKGASRPEVVDPSLSAGHLPPGPRSVPAASSGVTGPAQYGPVPMATVPQTRPPEPPRPVVPKTPPSVTPPQTGKAVNTFSVPEHASQRMPGKNPAGMVVHGYAGGPATGMAFAGSKYPMGWPTNSAEVNSAPGAEMVVAGGPNLVRTELVVDPRQACLPLPLGTKDGPPDTHQLVGVLRDALYPSQREWAAYHLGQIDWRTHPHVVDALVRAATSDPAPMVRVGCIRTLAKMNVNTVPVVTAVQALKTADDPRVRNEVDLALTKLNPDQHPAGQPTVVPASFAVPSAEKK
jgi:homeobox protein ESX1